MRISFAPFGLDEAMYLSAATGADFTRTDFTRERWLCVAARDEAGRLAGVACFEFKTWFDAHFSCAITDRRCMTRRLLRAMFKAAFSRAVRVTAMIRPGNDNAIRQARLMGFRDEGFCRVAIEGRYDALLLGMLPEDCRYLKRLPAALPVAVRENFHGLDA